MKKLVFLLLALIFSIPSYSAFAHPERQGPLSSENGEIGHSHGEDRDKAIADKIQNRHSEHSQPLGMKSEESGLDGSPIKTTYDRLTGEVNS